MKLRIPDADLEIGDVAVHGEEAYPSEDLISVSAGMASEASPSAPDGNEPEKAVPARTDDT
jgi:Amt family ammonium transporter